MARILAYLERIAPQQPPTEVPLGAGAPGAAQSAVSLKMKSDCVGLRFSNRVRYNEHEVSYT